MSVVFADPGFSSRILICFHPRSEIRDPKTKNEEGETVFNLKVFIKFSEILVGNPGFEIRLDIPDLIIHMSGQ